MESEAFKRAVAIGQGGLLALCAGYSGAAGAGTPSTKTPGLEHDVIFSEFPTLARNEALAERLLTPLTCARLIHKAQQSGAIMREYPLDLAREKYVTFVPLNRPTAGYGLLVFIEPWQDAGVPRAWIPVLNKHGVIFITAEESGNTESVYERRIPLALIAAHNMMKQYSIDPEKVYIGGMSGGSRVAERMALAYPDLFRAVLLHSSSDPIGTREVPLPAPALFRQFQESMRLVFITGQYDAPNIEKDEIARASLKDWCAFDIVVKPFPFAGHELAGASDFEPALSALEGRADAKPKLLATCREHKATELNEKLKQAEVLLSQGNSHGALNLLEQIDAHFGGLAAPQSLDLASRLNTLN